MEARIERERTVIGAQIEATDRLVYELYGLTDDEIRIVEGARPDDESACCGTITPRRQHAILSASGEQVRRNPEHTETQANGRIRHWGFIEEIDK